MISAEVLDPTIALGWLDLGGWGQSTMVTASRTSRCQQIESVSDKRSQQQSEYRSKAQDRERPQEGTDELEWTEAKRARADDRERRDNAPWIQTLWWAASPFHHQTVQTLWTQGEQIVQKITDVCE